MNATRCHGNRLTNGDKDVTKMSDISSVGKRKKPRRPDLDPSSSTSILVSPSRKSLLRTSRPLVRVCEGPDVTPRPLIQTRTSRLFLDQISAGSTSDHNTNTNTSSSSFNLHLTRSILGSSRISSQSTISESISEEIEDSFSRHRDIPSILPDVLRGRSSRRSAVKEALTEEEESLREVSDVYITETHTVTLLELPQSFTSLEDQDADTLRQRNRRYEEVCRNRVGNDVYVDRWSQTLSGAEKHKHVQTSSINTTDTACNVSEADLYDVGLSPHQEEEEQEEEEVKEEEQEESRPDLHEENSSSRAGEHSVSVGSTVSTGSTSSSSSCLKEVAAPRSSECDPALLLTERIQHLLLVMERSLLANVYQEQLAKYRQLTPPAPPEGSPAAPPAPPPVEAERLWSFSCDLTRGRRVSSMTWNKTNTDLLAVGYSDPVSRTLVDSCSPGLVCCWSLTNPTWPQRVVRCEAAVTSLDFSCCYPAQLAAGLQDGTILVLGVSSPDCSGISSRECPTKHWDSVRGLRFLLQEQSLTGDEEFLFSVAEDGRVSRWSFSSTGLDCSDVVRLTKERNSGSDLPLSDASPGLCLDFSPSDSSVYLVGTSDGLIHKGSCSSNLYSEETYSQHLSHVTSLTWSPFVSGAFLSSSSDGTVQLWNQDLQRPVLGLASTRTPVDQVHWSPRWAAVFGALKEDRLEVWDLDTSTLEPVLVLPAPDGVEMETLMFAPDSDSVLVGDSEGNVTVYVLRNLSQDHDRQVKVLENLVHSGAPPQPQER